MSIYLTDSEIGDLINEQKIITEPLSAVGALTRHKRAHREGEITIQRMDGSSFKVITRQSIVNLLDFSVILGYCPPNSNEVFRLRRYNGKSHSHSNNLEGGTAFYDFHIHTATERYQQAGLKEDFYAEPTVRYSDVLSAVNCCISDCNIISSNEQSDLFN